MNSIPCFSIKLVPYHLIYIKGENAHYIELLCNKYDLTDDELISKALGLAEVNLAESEARMTASSARGCYET